MDPIERICIEQGFDYLAIQGAINAIANVAVTGVTALTAVTEAFAALHNSLLKAFSDIIPAFNCAMNDWDEELFFMIPPHIKHLAYKHPKARVRKKNWNRMWKIHKRYMKCHK